MTRQKSGEKRSLSHAFDLVIDNAILLGRMEKKKKQKCNKSPDSQADYSQEQPVTTLIEEMEREFYWDREQERLDTIRNDEWEQLHVEPLRESDDEYLLVIKDVLDDIEYERMEYEREEEEYNENIFYWRHFLSEERRLEIEEEDRQYQRELDRIMKDEEIVKEIEYEERLKTMTFNEIMREALRLKLSM